MLVLVLWIVWVLFKAHLHWDKVLVSVSIQQAHWCESIVEFVKLYDFWGRTEILLVNFWLRNFGVVIQGSTAIVVWEDFTIIWVSCLPFFILWTIVCDSVVWIGSYCLWNEDVLRYCVSELIEWLDELLHYLNLIISVIEKFLIKLNYRIFHDFCNPAVVLDNYVELQIDSILVMRPNLSKKDQWVFRLDFSFDVPSLGWIICLNGNFKLVLTYHRIVFSHCFYVAGIFK